MKSSSIINRITIALCIPVITLFFLSCQKESGLNENPVAATTEEETITYSEESMEAEASFDDVEDISLIAAEEEAEETESGGRNFSFIELRLRLGSCANITVTPGDGTYPKTITIDFGDGCICADGKFRKGAIILHLTAPIRRPGAVLTITFRNYYLNRAHIEGTKIITNHSENGNIKFTVQVVDGKVTLPGGRGFTYNGMKYVKQVLGGSTRNLRDDVYTIEGRSKTVFNSGVTVTLNTERPLVKKVVCPWINRGVVKIKINDRVLFLDYGAPDNGECDNKALLTWNNGNNHRLITLP